MKKTAALLMIVSLLMTGCGSEPSGDVITSDNTTSEATTTDLAAEYGIISANYNGTDICIISGEHVKYEYMVEGETGDVVDDAIFMRNRKVEELLNVSFSFVSSPNYTKDGEFYALIRNDVLAGDSTYDIINGLNCWTTPLIFEGIFRRLDTISTIDFDHPWWVPGLTLDGSDEIYYAFSDASLSLYKDLYVMFFNKSIIEDNKLEDPYGLVKSGKWTIDEFIKLANEGSRDLNGDGSITVENDQIAYVAKHAANRGFMTATGTSVFITGDDGKPKLNGISERLFNAYEKLRPFLSDKELAYIDMEADVILLSKPFIEGRALFLTNCLMAVEGMRDMSVDYGIVPLPKYDEAQETYNSQIATSTSALYLPTTAENPEMLGAVMEALGFYSYTEVVPTYYETALNVKYARDDTVQEMLTLIRENASTNIDFSYNTIFWTNDVFNQALEDKDIASWYAGMESSTQATLDQYLAIDIDG